MSISSSSKEDEEVKLREVYYKPEHLWVGKKAIRKLHKVTKIAKAVIKSWLAKQALWQVHMPRPKSINRPHFEINIPNQQHQFDLLYMPHNVVYGSTYKYILTGVDVASRYKIARPLRTKKQVTLLFY